MRIQIVLESVLYFFTVKNRSQYWYLSFILAVEFRLSTRLRKAYVKQRIISQYNLRTIRDRGVQGGSCITFRFKILIKDTLYI